MIRPGKDSSSGLSIAGAAIQPPLCRSRLLCTECHDWGRMSCTARESVCLRGLEIRLIHRTGPSPDLHTLEPVKRVRHPELLGYCTSLSIDRPSEPGPRP